MKRETKKKILTAISVLCLIGCIICIGITALFYWQRYEAQREYERLKEQSEDQNESLNTAEGEFVGFLDGEESAIPDGILTDMKDHPVNFEKLFSYNTDLYAWIRIPKTKIDYPVAQYPGDDQTYYLKHDFKGDPQIAGCIFSEKSNATDFEDPVTVLYGHHMKNGSMFQNLLLYQDEEFFDKHRYVYIYTPDKARVYKIISAYEYDDRNIMNAFDFSDKSVFKEYRRNIRHPRSMTSVTRNDVKMNSKSKILTLSTCVAWRTGYRFLVQAVLQYEEEWKN